jgi:hypothetical protein
MLVDMAPLACFLHGANFRSSGDNSDICSPSGIAKCQFLYKPLAKTARHPFKKEANTCQYLFETFQKGVSNPFARIVEIPIKIRHLYVTLSESFATSKR